MHKHIQSSSYINIYFLFYLYLYIIYIFLIQLNQLCGNNFDLNLYKLNKIPDLTGAPQIELPDAINILQVLLLITGQDRRSLLCVMTKGDCDNQRYHQVTIDQLSFILIGLFCRILSPPQASHELILIQPAEKLLNG